MGHENLFIIIYLFVCFYHFANLRLDFYPTAKLMTRCRIISAKSISGPSITRKLWELQAGVKTYARGGGTYRRTR